MEEMGNPFQEETGPNVIKLFFAQQKSVSTYFQERFFGGIKSDNFGKLLSHIYQKNTSGPSKVILTENSKLITKQNEVR